MLFVWLKISIFGGGNLLIWCWLNYNLKIQFFLLKMLHLVKFFFIETKKYIFLTFISKYVQNSPLQILCTFPPSQPTYQMSF